MRTTYGAYALEGIMARLIVVRDRLTRAYVVRPVSFRGQPIGPDYQVVNVGSLAKQPAEFVARFLHVDTADLVQRFTRQSWLALRPDGSVAYSQTTKVGVQALILADYE